MSEITLIMDTPFVENPLVLAALGFFLILSCAEQSSDRTPSHPLLRTKVSSMIALTWLFSPTLLGSFVLVLDALCWKILCSTPDVYLFVAPRQLLIIEAFLCVSCGPFGAVDGLEDAERGTSSSNDCISASNKGSYCPIQKNYRPEIYYFGVILGN